ncbi:hypothetical protein ACIG8S_04405 [[Kitasatospora] papulosa]|uniref:hypothetical protein n=1 Tax=[Kitasatospora] papulosa TaxID=1464011 RepID=UPI0037D6AF18
MATELHIANEVLDDFEAIRPMLNGRETGRRASATCDACTILDMEMSDAPDQAATMEVILREVNGQPEVDEIHYWDKHGIFLAPVVPFPRKVS